MMRSITTIVIAALLLLAPAAQALEAERLIRDGNDRYQKEEYDAALETYKKAAENERVAAFVAYNSGNALFRQKKYGEAIDSFKKVYAKEHPQLYRAAQHNIGCAQYRQAEPLIEKQEYEPALEKLKGAMSTYRHALREAPGDADMKYNYQQARRKFKEVEKLLQQQQKQPKDQQDQKDDKKEDEKKQDQNKDQQDQKQQDEKQKQDEKDPQQNQQNKQDGQEQEQQKTEQEKMEELSKEMARQLLESLFEDQKPEDMEKLYQLQGRKVPVEKDW